MDLRRCEDSLSNEDGASSVEPDSDVPELPGPGRVLTPLQRKILAVIAESVQRDGYPPSMREIADMVGLASKSSVSYQLSVLQKKGYLRRKVGRPRTVEIRLPGHPAARPEPSRQDGDTSGAGDIDFPLQEMRSVPVMGQIAAGPPKMANENLEGTFDLPRQLVGDGALFALRVRGDSMINAGILDGDWVVVRQQKTASSGDLVVALLDEEVTVKTYRHSDGHVSGLRRVP